MPGTVFKTIKRLVDKDDKEHFIVSFEFPCNSFTEAEQLKKYIEGLNFEESPYNVTNTR